MPFFSSLETIASWGLFYLLGRWWQHADRRLWVAAWEPSRKCLSNLPTVLSRTAESLSSASLPALIMPMIMGIDKTFSEYHVNHCSVTLRKIIDRSYSCNQRSATDNVANTLKPFMTVTYGKCPMSKIYASWSSTERREPGFVHIKAIIGMSPVELNKGLNDFQIGDVWC